MTIINNYLCPDWPAPANVVAFTTTRQGGFSQPPYASMNLASHVLDDPLQVEKNIQKLMQEKQLPHRPRWLTQVHGTTVIPIADSNNCEADACYTHRLNHICAVLTADCLPILICNQQGNEIAAIHAGWRGLLAGIIDNTLQQLHSSPNTLYAWLGPAIGPQHFLINNHIYIDFLRRDSHNSQCFIQQTEDHWLANIYQLARLNLQRLGVQQIFGGDYCTFADEQWFYSFRRDQKMTGRMATMIWLKN